MMSQGDDARSGQRRNIDDRCRVEASRVVKRITQDEPALGVGVEDLDGLAGSAGDDVPGFDRMAAGHVLYRRHEPDDPQGQAQLGNEIHRGDHGSSAAHVEFHLVHGPRILQGDAAGVEGHALANEHHAGLVRLGASMLQDDEAGRLMAALGHGQQTTHLLAADGRLIEDLDSEGAVALGQRAGLFGQIDRGAEI